MLETSAHASVVFFRSIPWMMLDPRLYANLFNAIFYAVEKLILCYVAAHGHGWHAYAHPG